VVDFFSVALFVLLFFTSVFAFFLLLPFAISFQIQLMMINYYDKLSDRLNAKHLPLLTKGQCGRNHC
jgi:hypothetical protein